MELKKREEIIKALECCYTLSSDCLSCPFIEDNKSCASISLMAFALIKELMQEIKDLEADYDRVYEQAEADIHGNMADGGMSCHWCMEKTKADTVKRMSEMLKEYLDDFYNSGEDVLLDVPDLIDQIAEEILEEKNG